MRHLTPLAAAACLALASCATVSAPDFYKPPGEKRALEITAKQEPMKGGNGYFEIYIDGELALEKPIPLFSGNLIEADGEWRGKRIRASIVRIQTFSSAYTRITVFIDGEHAAVLTI